MKGREEKEKSKLTIRLAEPVVYLKDVDFSGRHQTHNELSPPSMVRGILVLHLSKPTKICSIDIELTAKSSVHYPEAVGVGRTEGTEEHELYSSSTVYFRQEAGGHPSRRAVSLDPMASRTTIEEDDSSFFDLGIDHEDSDTSRARGCSHDALRGRRCASVDLCNFDRDAVSHHATTHIPSPAYNPTADDSPHESPASSVADLSTAHLTPPPDQGPASQPRSLSHVRPSPSPAQHDQRSVMSGTSNGSVLCPPASHKRAGQALEDFQRASRSDPTVTSVRPTPLNETPIKITPSRRSDGSDDGSHGRRRSKSRFSLSAISDAIIDSMKSHHSTLTTKRKDEEASMRSDAHDSWRSRESSRGRSREKGKGKDLSHALIRVSEVFGLEHEEGKESRGWKEFKRGTYTYPISFAIPADSPPSLDCLHGSIVWNLKATVHRPGKFTPRMETVRSINVVATPSEDATEDVENVSVNKTWEDQMVYYLSIVGRAFPIGTKIPMQLTFMPLAKVKIYKVSVVIDEKVTYYSQTKTPVKAPSTTRHVLCCLKHPDKGNTPILPLIEEDLRKSPLYKLVHEGLDYNGQTKEERASELISEWMGPGPWPLRFNVEIASTRLGSLRPTNMNKEGNITVCHVLKIIIRVQKGDVDHAEDSKKKMYDIVIQYPFHLLSHLCNQKFTSLPPYSLTWHTVPAAPGQSSSSEPGPSSIVHEVSAIDLEPSTPEYTAPTVHVVRTTSREREELTHQFERLIAGQEAETGEAPPSYKAATSPVSVHHSQLLHV